LIPPKTTTGKDGQIKRVLLANDNKDKVLQIEVDKIKVNPFQPRKNFEDGDLNDLIESIKEYGIVQPLIVSQGPDGF